MAVECTYCEEKVNAKRGIYIKCTTCQDVKLCLECFSAGAEIDKHQSDHPYELIDCGSFPIIDESWKAYEELALLEAIELYGIGSWTDIANAVGTRSAEECSERYLRVYVDNFFGRCAWNAIDKDLYAVHDHTCAHNRPLSPSLSLPERHKIVDISREQQIRLGYMPKRDDFEREYDNEAELLVAKLAVNANDDTELDQDLKIAHINMYTDKLRERFRRKRIVLEYNLVKLFFHMHPEENGDLAGSGDTQTTTMTMTKQYQTDNLSHSIIKNSDSALSSPTPSKNDQILPMDEVESCATPVTKDQSTNFKNNFSYQTELRSDDHKTGNSPGQNTILNYFRRVDPPNSSTKRSNSSTSNSSDHPENSILSSYFSDLNKTIAEQDFNTMEKKLRIFCQFSSAEEHNRLIRNLAREKEIKVRIKELMEKRKNGTNNQTSDPCWRLLSESEKRLCRTSNLKAAQYISFKASLIKDYNQKKKKGIAQRLAADGNIDKNVKRRIVDFLTRNNWIKV